MTERLSLKRVTRNARTLMRGRQRDNTEPCQGLICDLATLANISRSAPNYARHITHRSVSRLAISLHDIFNMKFGPYRHFYFLTLKALSIHDVIVICLLVICEGGSSLHGPPRPTFHICRTYKLLFTRYKLLSHNKAN